MLTQTTWSSQYNIVLFCCHLLAQITYICAQNNDTTSNTTGLIGAVPKEKLIYKKAIACENQKLYISCPDIYDKMQINGTFYGRQDSTTCNHPKLPNNKNCTEQTTTVKNIVNDLCNGESQCEVSVTNDFLAQSGTIICPNVYKYLTVDYRCLPENVVQNTDDDGHLPDNIVPNPSSDNGVPAIPGSRSRTPLQCCYVVPGAASIQSAVDNVGATITRHVGGVQSVEERIVAQHIQVPQISTVTEIIHGASGQSSSSTFSVNPPPLVTIPSSGQAVAISSGQASTTISSGQSVTNSGQPAISGQPSTNTNTSGQLPVNKTTRSVQPSTTKPLSDQAETSPGQPPTATISSGQPAVNSGQVTTSTSPLGQPGSNTSGQPSSTTLVSGKPTTTNTSTKPTSPEYSLCEGLKLNCERSPMRTAEVEISTLLQKQAKGLGLTNLISIDPSHIGSILANPSKKSVLRKPQKFSSHKRWFRVRKKVKELDKKLLEPYKVMEKHNKKRRKHWWKT